MSEPIMVPVVMPCKAFCHDGKVGRTRPIGGGGEEWFWIDCPGCDGVGHIIQSFQVDPSSREARELAYGRAMGAWFNASDSGDDVTAMLIWAEDVEPAEKALRGPPAVGDGKEEG